MTTLNVIETEREKPATIAEMALLSFAGAEDLSACLTRSLPRSPATAPINFTQSAFLP